jgi:hypothetical protein
MSKPGDFSVFAIALTAHRFVSRQVYASSRLESGFNEKGRAMKKTDLAKSDAKKLMNQMSARNPSFGAAATGPAPDRREQRERERALGLVPFAVKLNSDLVQQLQTLSKERGVELNELVAELLQKGLSD